MVKREVEIRNSTGIHARLAAIIVRTSARFAAECRIQRDDCEVDGKSIIGVMTLAAEQGAKLTLIFDGRDEEEAAIAMEALFAAGFEETAQYS